jgi:hypothetical protein
MKIVEKGFITITTYNIISLLNTVGLLIKGKIRGLVNEVGLFIKGD